MSPQPTMPWVVSIRTNTMGLTQKARRPLMRIVEARSSTCAAGCAPITFAASVVKSGFTAKTTPVALTTPHRAASLPRPDAIQIAIRADEELAARQRWAGVDAAGVAQVVGGEDLEILGAQDIGDAAAGEKGDGFPDDDRRGIEVGQVLQGLALEDAAVFGAQ